MIFIANFIAVVLSKKSFRKISQSTKGPLFWSNMLEKYCLLTPCSKPTKLFFFSLSHSKHRSKAISTHTKFTDTQNQSYHNKLNLLQFFQSIAFIFCRAVKNLLAWSSCEFFVWLSAQKVFKHQTISLEKTWTFIPRQKFVPLKCLSWKNILYQIAKTFLIHVIWAGML